jgi:beta-N-acetylhexosaminidase
MDHFARLAGGVIVGGFDGTTLPEPIRERLARGHLAGVTLFKRNIASAEQTAALCAAIADAAPTDAPAIISIDQEGGRVARLGPPVTPLPPMRVLGAIDDVALTKRAGRMLGEALGALGINLDFAPVADVDSNPANPIIGDRAFGREPARVARHVAALIEGLQGAGVLGCAKHFPGHGDTEQDSHLELPRVRHDRARLEAIELPPFRAAVGAGVASFMTAHVVYEGLVPGVPATLARAIVTDLLRGELGFRGVCFSDDLHMNAVSARHGVEESSVLAITAGCDALLICTDPDSQERARVALEERARRDEGFAARLREANERVLAMRRRGQPRPVRDPAALRAALENPEHARLREEIAERAQRTGA